jgi:hypothetical protein
MEEDPKQDYEELKRQDRKFLWGLVAFVLTTCIGGILYVVNQAPNLAKKDSPIPPNDPIVKRLAEEEAKRVKTKIALEELVKLAKECQSIDTEVLQILREILKNPAERKLNKDLLSRLRELEKQRTIKTAQLDNLSCLLSRIRGRALAQEACQAYDIEQLPPRRRSESRTLFSCSV